jgi:hypothetical protein
MNPKLNPLRTIMKHTTLILTGLACWLCRLHHAHEGHGLPGISHWHSTDVLGFVVVAALIAGVIWFKGASDVRWHDTRRTAHRRPRPDLNPGRRTLTLVVENAGDRPIQVGSHYHFAETNNALRFDRAAAQRHAAEHRLGHRRALRAGPATHGRAGGLRRRAAWCMAFGA